MVVLSLAESRRTGKAVEEATSTPVERHPATSAAPPQDVAGTPRTAEQVYIDGLRDELDEYYTGLKTLAHMPPEEVFHWLSAVSARLVEVRAHLHRSESRRCAALRTREVDPLLEEVDRQFKFHSRIAAMNELEWKMQGGAPS